MKKSSLTLAFAVLILGACGTAKAQAPVAGQPYQVPPGYEAYGAGTLVTYSGYNYVLQGNGTMLLGSPSVTCNQTSTCYQQPVTYYQQPVQPTAYYYYYRPSGYYRHHGCHSYRHCR